MGWWIALAVLMGLAILPLGVSARYNAEGFRLSVIAGPIRFRVLPAKKKEEKPKKEKNKKEKPVRKRKEPVRKEVPKKAAAPQKAPEQTTKPAEPPKVSLDKKYPNLNRKPRRIPKEPVAPEEPEEGGSWKDFLSLIPIVLDFLGAFRRKLRVDRLEMKLIMAGGDPCDLAVNYGKTWTAVGNLLPSLERWFVIKNKDVEVECDFTASETLVVARLEITITLGRLLSLAAVYAVRGIREFIVFRNKRKGGALK